MHAIRFGRRRAGETPSEIARSLGGRDVTLFGELQPGVALGERVAANRTAILVTKLGG